MRERVFGVIQAFAGGVLITLLATVVHAEWFPWALIASLGTVASYLLALRLLTDDRMVSASGAVAVFVTVMIFSAQSPGGSVLIQASFAGNVWVFGSAVLAGLAAAWPQISFRPRD